MDDNDDCGFDEGSDVDNWETEQVFQDQEGMEDEWLDASYEAE